MQKLYGLEHSKCTFVSLSITFFMWKLYGYWLYRTLTKEILIAFCRHPRLGAFTIASDHVNGPYFPYMTATVTFCTINCKQDEKKVKLQTHTTELSLMSFRRPALRQNSFQSMVSVLIQYTLQNTQYDRQYTIHNAQYTMHNAQCTMHNTQCTMHNAQCTIYNAQCTIYNIQCTIRCSSFEIRPIKWRCVVLQDLFWDVMNFDFVDVVFAVLAGLVTRIWSFLHL